jgi:hypothetical protein
MKTLAIKYLKNVIGFAFLMAITAGAMSVHFLAYLLK